MSLCDYRLPLHYRCNFSTALLPESKLSVFMHHKGFEVYILSSFRFTGIVYHGEPPKKEWKVFFVI
jgi:hypothetical protein